MEMTQCEHCGVAYGVGQSPYCKDGHGRVLPSKGFEPYFNISLGRYVTGWGDIRQAMRQEKVDFRDHPRPGDVSARRDRIEQQKARRHG